MRHQIASDWDELRQRVRSAAAARGLRVVDVGPAIGRSAGSIANALYSTTPPSVPLQMALRAWLNGRSTAATLSGAAAGGASEARADAALQHACASPATAPPSWDPSPRPLMCAPSAKIPVAAGFVSSPVTPVCWEYWVCRLPDHDWREQASALNVRGLVGWELVSVSGGVAYMRRGRVRGVCND